MNVKKQTAQPVQLIIEEGTEAAELTVQMVGVAEKAKKKKKKKCVAYSVHRVSSLVIGVEWFRLGLGLGLGLSGGLLGGL